MDYDSKPKMEYSDPRDYNAEQIQEFLKKIAMLESSGGKNINHKTMESGLHEGDAAVGNYGIMPETMVEITRRYPSEHNKGLTKEQLEIGAIVDPEMAHNIAGSLASFLKNKRGLSDEQAAVAWEQGHNTSEPKLKMNSDRAKKFRVLSNAK